jgi:uncharacterized protein (DUF927 family)
MIAPEPTPGNGREQPPARTRAPTSAKKPPKGASRRAPKERKERRPGQDLVATRKPKTAEELAAEQTIEHLALRIFAAMVSEKILSGMSTIFDELITENSDLLNDDDDEEQDEDWIDDRREREGQLLEEGIAYGLETYPDFDSINALPPHSDPDVADAAAQLKQRLAQLPIGATQFEDKFSREQFQRMVRRALKAQLERNPSYTKHIRSDVPGSNPKSYGSKGRTTSKGTFAKSDTFEDGGGLAALLTAGWMRVAKDRIDPVAWSHEFGPERKTERKNWHHRFKITEKAGHVSFLEVPRQALAGNGQAAIRLLMKAGVHVIRKQTAVKALVRFLGFKPKHEIVRMKRPGWAEVNGHWIFVRADEVIRPADMPGTGNISFVLDSASRHGLHVAGTSLGWATEIAEPLRGNSNVALSFGTFFAAPLLCFANEPGGGNHLCGKSTIGKTMASDAGQSINGWPHETADETVGVSWGGTEAGFDALAQARTDLGLGMDEITLSDPRTAEQIIYKVASGTQGPRATSIGQQRETTHATVLVLSTGEKPLTVFIKAIQEGARKRLVDVPAEVQPGSAFETIPRDQLHAASKRLFKAMKKQHGAVGREWQRHLVKLTPVGIQSQLDENREAFLALPEVAAIVEEAHPQVQAVVNRFALYAAALQMAIGAGLLPWTIEEADAGIVACMSRWVKQRGNLDTAGEVQRAVVELERKIAAALADRFIHLRQDARGHWVPASDAEVIKQKTPAVFDGYAKPDRILIRPEAWHRLCDGHDAEQLVEHLRHLGKLIPGSGGKTARKERILDESARYYVLQTEPTGTLEHRNTAIRKAGRRRQGAGR